MINQTLEKLQTMKQAAMVAEYRRQIETSGINELTFEERLAMIVDAQWLSRQNARLKRLLHAANLRDPAATLSDLSYKPERMLDKNQVARLSDLQWIRDGRNLLVTGPTGTGKTYLVSAFGREACRAGMTVRCYKMSRLLLNLSVGRGDGSYEKLIGDLKKPDLLILDDFGLETLQPLACLDLYEVVDELRAQKIGDCHLGAASGQLVVRHVCRQDHRRRHYGPTHHRFLPLRIERPDHAHRFRKIASH
jgi:DNA replication protein DnaC